MERDQGNLCDTVLGKIVSIYNNTIAKIPGIAKIDMEKVEGSLNQLGGTTDSNGNRRSKTRVRSWSSMQTAWLSASAIVLRA